jgi:hypothetical protein
VASGSNHKLIYAQPHIPQAVVSFMLKNQTKKSAVDQATAKRILASVPYERGFHFFSGVGKYTGETAVNLFSFLEELRTIEPQSLRFHFERGDFQKWIAETLGDQTLSEKISALDVKASDESLKRELLRIVQMRFEEIQTISQTQ